MKGAAVSGCFLPSWSLSFLRSHFQFQFSRFQHLASIPSVGVQVGQGEELFAGLFEVVFHSQPVWQHALDLLLAGDESVQAPEPR